MGDRLLAGTLSPYVCNKPTRSTQPGSLNRVQASARVRAGGS